jgi:hypothetical protein
VDVQTFLPLCLLLDAQPLCLLVDAKLFFLPLELNPCVTLTEELSDLDPSTQRAYNNVESTSFLAPAQLLDLAVVPQLLKLTLAPLTKPLLPNPLLLGELPLLSLQL